MWRNIMEEPSVVSIMLLGLTGSGKSASGNTIIGVRETFKEDLSPEAVTRFCQSAQTELGGQTITVIDTVGLSDTSVKITNAQTQIEQILQSTCDGVDVFLLVIKLGETLTEESRKVVKWIKNNFGSKLLKHTIVLFTHGDLLHKPIERYLGECETLRSVVDQCSGGYHVFNNKDEDRSQVTELMKKTKSLRMMNAYKRYTEQDYKETQNYLLLKKAAVGAGVGGVVTAAGGGGAMASMMGTAFTVGKAAVIGAAGSPVLAAGGGVGAMASMMGTAFTVGKAAIIGAGGPAVAAAAAAVGSVIFLAKKYR